MKQLNPADFILEIQFLLAMLAYISNFFRGRQSEMLVVKAWLHNTHAIFRRQFSSLGDDDGHLLLKQSNHKYLFYASGRKYCRYLTATLTLTNRQDPFMHIYEKYYTGVSDEVQIQVVMDDSSMDPFVFAIVPFKKEKALRRDRYDLQTFAKTLPQKPEDPFRKEYAILTDCAELTDILLPKHVQRLLLADTTRPYIQSIVFSDQPETMPAVLGTKVGPKTLTFRFLLPSVQKMSDVHVMQDLVFLFIDAIAEKARLRGDLRTRADRLRREAEESWLKATHLDRQEASQQRRIEKLKKEGRLDEANKRKKKGTKAR
jgi:hypothetical protein